jgi:DNA-binding FadR family transcriptional regulator
LLYKIYQMLQFAQWTIFTTRTSKLGLKVLAQRHESLLAALATRDPDVIDKAMRHHIEELGSPLESMLDDSMSTE